MGNTDEHEDRICIVCKEHVSRTEAHHGIMGKVIHEKNDKGRRCYQEWSEYQQEHNPMLRELEDQNFGDC